MKPRITLLMGDRNGIGPELIARLLARAATRDRAEVEVLGDPDLFEQGRAVAHVMRDRAPPFVDCRPIAAIETTPGRATGAAGAEVLALLARGAARVMSGQADGVVFAPLNKEAMHLGGLRLEDELRYLAATLGYRGAVGELNVLDGLWTTRVTSHLPLKDVAAAITLENVLGAIRFAQTSLMAAGSRSPRIAVAALNPHAGDGGNFGREEIEAIGPAIAKAREAGVDASGPYPSDTVFVRARDGAFDAVVTMYHDQGQIAMKLMGFARGVTVLGGLPVPFTTCGHGTGYDIVGKGVARPESIVNAFEICCDMAASRAAHTLAV